MRERLIARIRAQGPITVADYMDACLHDPEDGYYARRPGLGTDFITAPHVSQMFGELLGLWAAEVWLRLGRPGQVRLVELGPGDGTLMADALRAARVAPAFLAAARIVLMETSAPLRQRQAEALAGHAPQWIARIVEVGDDAPVIILANEFLDCLPVRQAVRTVGGWRERRIGVDEAGSLDFVQGEPAPDITAEGAPGAVHEWSPDLADMGSAIGALVARAGGAALFIDYGRPGPGDSLQAVRGHQKESPLDNAGLADLTAHVDFAAFLRAAEAAGADAWPLFTQAEFLRRLGIEQRAATLVRAHPGQGAKIGRQLERLIAPGQMGTLFKAGCVTSAGLAAPGFEPA